VPFDWLLRARFGRPLVLAAGVSGLALSTAGLWPERTDYPVFVSAAAVSVVLLAAAAWLPWESLPVWLMLTVPVGCDLLVALLRQSQGGANSGYSPLVMIPVVWSGLVLGRRAVLAVAASTTLLFVLPILIEGPPLYPDNGWRGVVLWALIALFVGLGADLVMRAQQEQTALADARARELDHLAETQNAIATSRFDLDAVLTTVVEEAKRLTDAHAAVVETLDGDELVYRAASGTAVQHVGLRLRSAGALSGLALRENEALVCRDAETDGRVDLEACRRVGARSLVVVPLRHDGHPDGVLKVYSPHPDAFRAEHVRVLSLLADMIASALARAELLEQLNVQALTDELTGLPNRRSWYDHLEHALARARRSGEPLSLVVLDLNGFKQVNDRQGHAAGDRVLRTVSACWSSVLRDSDILGRIGGDEFAVILEQADEATAAHVVGRLADSLRTGEVGAATGTATWDRTEDAEALLSRADAAMYERKTRTAA
jgi:diguanylate cyclase (GGDEF)-like protein